MNHRLAKDRTPPTISRNLFSPRLLVMGLGLAGLLTTGLAAQSPDLSLTQGDGGAIINVGNPVTYTLVYANNGGVDATGVVLTETVPAGTIGGINPGWELAPLGSGTPCQSRPAGTVCVTSVGTLAVGGMGSTTFQVFHTGSIHVNPEIVITGSIADDGSSGADADPADNVSTDNTPIQEGIEDDLPEPLTSLKSVPVPLPDNLDDFIKDTSMALALGKALFWDMQVGSDNVQACASCHFAAGSDNRAKNQLNPGSVSTGGTGFDLAGPNYKLRRADFPLHKLADHKDRQSAVIHDFDDTVSSQGVTLQDFVKIKNSGVEQVTHVADPDFQVNGLNTRRVEPRNAPSAINAVFNNRNFWDGRAQNEFNGRNPFGSRDNNAKVLEKVDLTTVEEVTIQLKNASLASQALGPPESFFEMSSQGRTWPDIGKKLIRLKIPLAQQEVHPDDSVLGSLSEWPAMGLNTKYKQLIKAAFKNKWWKTDVIVTVTPTGLEFEPEPPGFKEKDLADNQYTQMMYNFPLFFGLATMLYEATLVSDDTPVDRWLVGETTALNNLEIEGSLIFTGKGRCLNCHGGGELTNASVRHVRNQHLERMEMGDNDIAVYDNGFYNIGVRPSTEDVGIGGTDPFGLPLSETGLAQLGLFVDPSSTPVTVDPGERIAVQGAFKTSQLRNVALTAPYMHNGGQSKLKQVIRFYNRGGDFSDQNIDDLDPDIRVLGLTKHERNALLAFLLALTDERVEYRKAPFDHPQLFVPNGHNGDEFSVLPGDDPAVARDKFLEIPAVGALGGTPLPRFLNIVETVQ